VLRVASLVRKFSEGLVRTFGACIAELRSQDREASKLLRGQVQLGCRSPRGIGSPEFVVKAMSRLFRSAADRASVGIQVGPDGHAAERGQ